jgi:hypothetical protein
MIGGSVGAVVVAATPGVDGEGIAVAPVMCGIVAVGVPGVAAVAEAVWGTVTGSTGDASPAGVSVTPVVVESVGVGPELYAATGVTTSAASTSMMIKRRHCTACSVSALMRIHPKHSRPE